MSFHKEVNMTSIHSDSDFPPLQSLPPASKDKSSFPTLPPELIEEVFKLIPIQERADLSKELGGLVAYDLTPFIQLGFTSEIKNNITFIVDIIKTLLKQNPIPKHLILSLVSYVDQIDKESADDLLSSVIYKLVNNKPAQVNLFIDIIKQSLNSSKNSKERRQELFELFKNHLILFPANQSLDIYHCLVQENKKQQLVNFTEEEQAFLLAGWQSERLYSTDKEAHTEEFVQEMLDRFSSFLLTDPNSLKIYKNFHKIFDEVRAILNNSRTYKKEVDTKLWCDLINKIDLKEPNQNKDKQQQLLYRK